MSQHRALGRIVRRKPPRRMSILCLVLVLAGALVLVVNPSAQAKPQQLLQSVKVSLGPDGSIRVIDSRTVGEGSDASPDQSLDPASVASQLPVRVLTSYQLGDRTGTDLSEIAGQSGRVTVNVTVQNTTVRPTSVPYDSLTDASSKPSYALVGTPLTVVASASLGDGDLSHVVTQNDVDRTNVTNGLLSTTDDGAAHVSWATMLAPPRLSPSATFTLVEDTDSFVVPTFDVNVQPGLVTDTSVDALLDRAFQKGDGSTQDIEMKSIALVDQVNESLNAASDLLVGIRSSLDDSAGTLGDKTVADLQQGQDEVARSIDSLTSSIDAQRDQISQELSGNKDDVLSDLGSNLDTVRALLGSPDDDAPAYVESSSSGRCGGPLPSIAKPGKGDAPITVRDRIQLIGHTLQTLKTSAGTCRDEVIDSLKRAIGSDSTYTCPASESAFNHEAIANPPAILALKRTQCAFDFRKQAIEGFAETLKDQQGRKQIAALAGNLDLLRQPSAADSIATIQSLAGQLTGVNGVLTSGEHTDARKLVDELTEVQGVLRGIDTQLGNVDLSDIQDQFDSISHIADQQIAALDGSSGQSSIIEDVTGLLNVYSAACPSSGVPSPPDSTDPTDPPDPDPGTPGGGRAVAHGKGATLSLGGKATGSHAGKPGTSQVTAAAQHLATTGAAPRTGPLADLIAYLLNLGTLCTTLQPPSTSLIDQLQHVSDAWHDVLDVTGDSTGTSGTLADAVAAIDQIRSQVTTPLLSELDDVLNATDGPAKQLQSKLTDLTTRLSGLYNATDDSFSIDAPSCSSAPSTYALNEAFRTFDAIRCQYDKLSGTIDSEFGTCNADATSCKGGYFKLLDDTDRRLQGGAHQITEALASSTRDFRTDIGQLGHSLDVTRTKLSTSSDKGLEKSRAKLSSTETEAGKRLDERTRAEIASVGDVLDSANSDVNSTNAILRADLQNVLADIGSPNDGGSGVLGQLQSSADDTVSTTDQIGDLSKSASGFGQVRGLELDQIALERAQLAASIDQARTFPPFGLDVPQGTRVLTVFTFHLGS